MTYLHPTYTSASVAAQAAAGLAEQRPARVRRRLPGLGLPRGRLPLRRRRRRGPGSGLVTPSPPRPSCRPTSATGARGRSPTRSSTGRACGSSTPTDAEAAFPRWLRAARVDPGRGPLRGRRPPPADREGAALPGRARPAVDRAPGADAGERPVAGLRLRPAHDVLLPRRGRHARGGARRGAQHLRRAALLPARRRRRSRPRPSTRSSTSRRSSPSRVATTSAPASPTATSPSASP